MNAASVDCGCELFCKNSILMTKFAKARYQPDMSQMSEFYLVAAVKRGDLKAYEQLFMHYYPIVRAFVLGFVKIDEQAKDISQDVFMKLWQYRESLDATKSIKPYVFLLARREVCSYFRSKQTVMEQNFSGGGFCRFFPTILPDKILLPVNCRQSSSGYSNRCRPNVAAYSR